MTPTKTLPALFLAATASLTVATLAYGQTSPEIGATAAPEATVAQADMRGDRGPRGGTMFGALMTQVDANGDGSVTQDEIDLFRAALVAGADASGDGAIDLTEFEAIFLELGQDQFVDRFQDLDADGDGTVTQAEMDDRFGGIVARMDRNDDGMLNADDRPDRGRDGDRDGGRARDGQGPRDRG